MVARIILDELTFGAVSRREQPLAGHIPYLRHVSDDVVKTKDGQLVSSIALDGYCFETADQADINARLLTRNVLVKTLGNSRYAIHSHIIRREVEPTIAGGFRDPFCAELDTRYAAQLGRRRMFVNDLYLTVVRRPLQGQ